MNTNLKEIIAKLGKSKEEDKLIEEFAKLLEQESQEQLIDRFSIDTNTGYLLLKLN